MRPGDKVIITKIGEQGYFNVGDIGVLVSKHGGDTWWADFTGNNTVYDDGQWSIDSCGGCEYELVN